MKTTDVMREVYLGNIDVDLASVKLGIPKSQVIAELEELKHYYASDVA